MAKKHVNRPLTIVAATSASFHIQDSVSKRHLLVDTGASKSIFPPSGIFNLTQKDLGFKLLAANNSPITTYGWKKLPVCFNNMTYSWDFLIADVQTPLLGADFLAHYNLLVDVKNRRLIDTTSFKTFQLSPSNSSNTISTVQPGPFNSLFKEFP